MQHHTAISPSPLVEPVAWTFADQVSSYRFWGLAGAWACSAFSMQALRTSVLDSARQMLAYGEIAQVMALGLPLGMLAGLVLGLLLDYLVAQELLVLELRL